jgi:hypothetical protein
VPPGFSSGADAAQCFDIVLVHCTAAAPYGPDLVRWAKCQNNQLDRAQNWCGVWLAAPSSFNQYQCAVPGSLRMVDADFGEVQVQCCAAISARRPQLTRRKRPSIAQYLQTAARATDTMVTQNQFYHLFA